MSGEFLRATAAETSTSAFPFADDRGGLFRCRLLHLLEGKVLPCLSDSFLPPACKCIVDQIGDGLRTFSFFFRCSTLFKSRI
ncbi:hypothetical protein BDA96_04G342100 [Sorghum bicolor]|uniref:Uncharacterized protein n=1 Tax=Sorghum bicolor TaxID=4558 RepID=A0A921R7P5_SORBI|nr:hypothetical protein BDA96_04G342100 [Sorghum bicolor]